MYNLTNVTNATTLYGQIEAFSVATGGAIFAFMLFVLYAIILMATIKQYGVPTSLIAGGFITTIVGGIFFTLGFLGMGIAIIPFILLCVGIVSKMFVD